MTNKRQLDNIEINFLDLIVLLWRGKWKIVAALTISVCIVFIYEFSQKNNVKNFTATTKINSVTTLEENKYIPFRKITLDLPAGFMNKQNFYDLKIMDFRNENFFVITKEILLSNYLDVLNDKQLFEEGIRKFNLLDVNQYSNDETYNEAVIKLASSIKILQPDEKIKNEFNIEFKYNNAEKWKSVLIYVDKKANLNVRNNLLTEFKTYLQIIKNEKQFKIEDLSLEIENLLDDYKRKTENRINYLKEQAAIAEELGIAKNTIEVQTFGSQNAMLSNVKTDSPFYLRGYKAINKEIELIGLRSNIKAFIPKLSIIEEEKRSVLQDKSENRYKTLIETSPLQKEKENEFKAASTKVYGTIYLYDNNRNIYIPAIILGLIIGVFYVLISQALQSRKSLTK